MKQFFTLIILLLCSSTLQAEEFNYSIGNLTNCQRRTASMPFNSQYVDFQYNSVTNFFTFKAKFSNQNGATLPDLLHFVVIPDNRPSYYAGRYVHVYVDLKNINNVIVTGYAFNGLNPEPSLGFLTNACGGSFKHSFTTRNSVENPQPAAANLFSSINNSSVVITRQASNETISGVTYRNVEVELDASAITNPTVTLKTDSTSDDEPETCPNGSYCCKDIFNGGNPPNCNWDGLKMLPANPSRSGFLLFLNSGGSISYSGNFINSLTTSSCSACFNTSVNTNRSPICSNVSFTNEAPFPGQSTVVTARFYDLDNDSQTVGVSNAPSGSSTSPSNGATMNLSGNFADVIFNWTPKLAQVGAHNISILTSQNYGGLKAAASCNFQINVQPLGDFVNTCLPVDLVNAKNNVKGRVVKIRNFGNKFYNTSNNFGGAGSRELNLRKNVRQLAKKIINDNSGYLPQIPNSGHRGTCPSFCPQDSLITLARINAADALLKQRIAVQRLGRITLRKLNSLGRTVEATQIRKQLRNALRLEQEAQSFLTGQIPAELFYCQF